MSEKDPIDALLLELPVWIKIRCGNNPPWVGVDFDIEAKYRAEKAIRRCYRSVLDELAQVKAERDRLLEEKMACQNLKKGDLK